MVDTDCKRKMVSSDSPKLSSKLHVTIPSPPFKQLPVSSPISCSAPSSCSAYELYLRLPELRNLWSSRDFPHWSHEPILKPALQALEITFRLVLAVCSDTRPYINHREWNRRLDTILTYQIQLISSICEEDEEEEEDRSAPVGKGRSSLSLLPQLATWRKTEAIGKKILSTIDNEMRFCKYTLGLGEQNITSKPNLQYDAVCRPNEVYNLKDNPYADHIDNNENETLYILHQIIESWLHVSRNLLRRINTSIGEGRFGEASRDVYLVERIWKLLTEVEDLHLLMDPEDFLKLKKQLHIKTTGKNDAFCFRSRGLVEVMKMSKGLSEKVPVVLDVEVDPTGGPRLQEAAMRLYARKGECDKIHLLQGMQAVEAAAKRFFFAYKQLVAAMMGSAEMNMECDSVSQIFIGLWEIDMDGKVNGAVETCFGSFHRYAQYMNFSHPLIKEKFNPKACAWAYGMNFFDLDAWRREKCTEEYHYWQNLNENRALWKLGTLPPGLITFYSTTKPLDKSWHVLGLGYNPSISMDEIRNAAVVHFNGNMKPWLDIAMNQFRPLWTKHVDYDLEFVQACNFGL